MRNIFIAMMLCLGFQVAQAAYFPVSEEVQQEVNATMAEVEAEQEEMAVLQGPPPFPVPGMCTCYVEDWHRRVYEGTDWNCRKAEDEALQRCQRWSRRCYYLGCERRTPF